MGVVVECTRNPLLRSMTSLATKVQTMWLNSNLTPSLQGLICLNGDIIRKDTINQMPPGNAKSLMDSVFDLAQRINRFQLSDAEIGLFCAVVIITPGK